MHRQPDAKTFVVASVSLQQLHDDAPPGHFTLGWLTGSLPKQSFRADHACGAYNDGCTPRAPRPHPAVGL